MASDAAARTHARRGDWMAAATQQHQRGLSDVTLDDVTMRLPQSVHRVADFVGVKLPETDVPAVPTRGRQADAVTEQFIAEWRHETGGCPACVDDTELKCAG